MQKSFFFVLCLLLTSLSAYSSGIIEDQSHFRLFKFNKSRDSRKIIADLRSGEEDLINFGNLINESIKSKNELPSALVSLDGFERNDTHNLISYITKGRLNFALVNIKKLLSLQKTEISNELNKLSKTASKKRINGKPFILFLNHIEELEKQTDTDVTQNIVNFLNRDTDSKKLFTIISLNHLQGELSAVPDIYFDHQISLKTFGQAIHEKYEKSAKETIEAAKLEKASLEERIDNYLEKIANIEIYPDEIANLSKNLLAKLIHINELIIQHDNLNQVKDKLLSGDECNESEQEVVDAVYDGLSYLTNDLGAVVLGKILNNLGNILLERKDLQNDIEKINDFDVESTVWTKFILDENKGIDSLLTKILEATGIVKSNLSEDERFIQTLENIMAHEELCSNIMNVFGGSMEMLLSIFGSKSKQKSEMMSETDYNNTVEDLWSRYHNIWKNMPHFVSEKILLADKVDSLKLIIKNSKSEEEAGLEQNNKASILTQEISAKNLPKLIISFLYIKDSKRRLDNLYARAKASEIENYEKIYFLKDAEIKINQAIKIEQIFQLGVKSQGQQKDRVSRMEKLGSEVLEYVYRNDAESLKIFKKL